MRRRLGSVVAGSFLLLGSASVLLAQTQPWWISGDPPATPAPLAAAPSEEPALAEILQLLPPMSASCAPRSTCCRVCDKGKACGNSCISRKFVCHKGRGCACDSAEVCR